MECYPLNALTDLDQVHIILNIVGSPNQDDLESVTSEQVCSMSLSMPLLFGFFRRDATSKAYPSDLLFHGINCILKQTNMVCSKYFPACVPASIMCSQLWTFWGKC